MTRCNGRNVTRPARRSQLAGCAVAAITVPLLTLISLAANAGIANAAAGATGNAATIAFYRTVVSVTRAAPGVDEVETGFTSLKETPRGTAEWFEGGTPPTGYKPVVDHIVIVAAERSRHMGERHDGPP